MFGSSKKSQEFIREYFRSVEFNNQISEYVSENLPNLVDNSEFMNIIGEKIDKIFSSTAVLFKINTEIEGYLKRHAHTYVNEQISDILRSEEIRSHVVQTVSHSIASFIEKNSEKSITAHLNSHDVVALVKARLKSSVSEILAGKDVSLQVDMELSDILDAKAKNRMSQLAKDYIESDESRQYIKDYIDIYNKDFFTRNYPPIIKVERVDGSVSEEIVVHRQFSTVLNACRIPNASVLMVGPAGSGKTQIAMAVAESLGKNFYFNGPVQSEYKLLGFRDATGNYSPTSFYNAYKKGGVYLFDEIDASSPQALLAFNTAIANRVCDFPGAGEPVKAADDFICLAAANTFGRGANFDYVGRNHLDAATLDRFIVVEIDYDRDMEMAISSNKKWAEKVQKWRRRAEELNVRHVISMRASILGSHLLKNFPEEAVEDMVVWRGLDRSTVAKIKAI